MTSVTMATDATSSSVSLSGSSGESVISSDLDTWLSLMTAQLENQDPFDPVDSSEYTAQLAQFSSVEQQVKTNDLLSELVSLSTTSDMATMADWVGKEVRTASRAYYQGAPVTAFASTDPTADHAEMVVLNSSGQEIDRFPIAVGDSQVEWGGSQFAWGSYGFRVESFDADNAQIAAGDAETYSEVLEVQMVNGRIELVLPGGTTLGTDAVSAIRAVE